ncbi:MAG: acyl-ACP thioesterase domain-containing protein [Bacteroidota bacterium]
MAAASGPHGRLTLPHLVRIFQEAAMRNTTRLGISSPELIRTHNSSWVLRRQTINCSRWPTLGEKVKVITAPSGFTRQLLTYRDFHLLDARGATIATAVTEWLLLDLERRRPRSIPSHIAALEADLAPASAHLKRPAGKVLPPSRAQLRRTAKVAFYQLDFNNHLTNPVFPELMLEPLGGDFLSGHLPTSIDISFQKEARFGEELTAIAAAEPKGYRHAMLRGEELLATMWTEWKLLES